MDELEMMQIQIDSINKACRTVLKSKIVILINNLKVELEELKDPNYVPNDIGIIRDKCAEIDELCIKIALLNRINNINSKK